MTATVLSPHYNKIEKRMRISKKGLQNIIKYCNIFCNDKGNSYTLVYKEVVMFIILIGSVARGDYGSESDIDICRIATEKEVKRKDKWPNGPLSYIDYDEETFLHLYNQGSLFIYHLFYEGILMKGDIGEWENLKNKFEFKDTYSEDLYKIKDIFNIFLNTEMFGGKFLSVYSNLFTLIKNYAIFYLAKNNIFILNKKQAVLKVFGDYYYDLLVSSYNYFERGFINENWYYDCEETAIKIINYYYSKMEAIENDKFSYGC
jgi:predicted nucleotidyltransferase